MGAMVIDVGLCMQGGGRALGCSFSMTLQGVHTSTVNAHPTDRGSFPSPSSEQHPVRDFATTTTSGPPVLQPRISAGTPPRHLLPLPPPLPLMLHPRPMIRAAVEGPFVSHPIPSTKWKTDAGLRN